MRGDASQNTILYLLKFKACLTQKNNFKKKSKLHICGYIYSHMLAQDWNISGRINKKMATGVLPDGGIGMGREMLFTDEFVPCAYIAYSLKINSLSLSPCSSSNAPYRPMPPDLCSCWSLPPCSLSFPLSLLSLQPGYSPLRLCSGVASSRKALPTQQSKNHRSPKCISVVCVSPWTVSFWRAPTQPCSPESPGTGTNCCLGNVC